MQAKTMTTTRCAVGFLMLVLLAPTVRGWADPSNSNAVRQESAGNK
jgi:hypothetical protein